MILSCNQIEKSFGTQVIVRSGSFHIENNEKAALVGINGAGKSTILRMIMEEEPLDGGSIIVSKDKTIGYLSQHQEMVSDHSIVDEISTACQDIIDLENKIRNLELSMKSVQGEELEKQLHDYHKSVELFERKNGYAYNSEIIGVLKGLGFEESEFNKQISSLSGGQKTRISLGKLLLTKPDILILDEPTNHLDLNSISWLETYLLNYKGAVLIVSHDRYFINRVVSKIIEIEHGELTMFTGNYTAYAEKKAQLRAIKLKEYYNQQQEIKHHESVIEKLKSYNREKSIKRAESREKMLAKIERIEKPITELKQMHFELKPHILSGTDVLTINGLKKSFDHQLLFDDVNIHIRRGEHIAVIGDNGTGKTTLLKIINDIIPMDAGEYILGSNVGIGYYDQEHHVLNMNKTIFDELTDDFPTLGNTAIRNTLAAFLFTGDDVYKRIQDLSGGERGRVSLAKLMLSEANFLILDEPTNHLDIQSKEILEYVICNYTGTVLYVSHDRYFINQTATRILELSNHSFFNYLGNYDYYLEKKEEALASNNIPAVSTLLPDDSLGGNEVKLDWKAQKEQQALQRKRENDLAKTEKNIADLEEESKELDIKLTLPEYFSDVAKCLELSTRKAEIEAKLEELYDQWETLSL